mmetsp:Transcript_21276/g.52064  ORF Transcript_21276/g.52064 Transcript_21276/m.52064 type:complete len:85 (-) Transcript_21276:169-423(-)
MSLENFQWYKEKEIWWISRWKTKGNTDERENGPRKHSSPFRTRISKHTLAHTPRSPTYPQTNHGTVTPAAQGLIENHAVCFIYG